MINPLLELKEVSYKSKNNFTLYNVCLRIKSGDKIALLGKSGAGKTCLLYTSPSPRDLSTSRMPSSA